MPAGNSNQLSFDLAFRPAMEREDFLVSECNATAVGAVDRFETLSPPILVIVGPAGAGKTHLSEVWRKSSNAVRADASSFDEEAAARMLAAGAGIIEDMPGDTGMRDEGALFHALNAAVQQRIRLLLTSRTPPPAWGLATQDVSTRLRLASVVTIGLPDDALFAALIMKLMADQQMTVAANALRYAVPRLERSFEAAERFVAAVERKSVERRRTVTLGIVREVIAGED